MKPLVSIVVPLYNYDKYIADCIESIIQSDYPNKEIIVIDDFSTDNSYKIAKKFKSEGIFVKRFNRNKGYSVVKNSGIKRSRGDYISILDADDLYTKDSISVRVEMLLENDVDFIHADALAINGDISLKQCYKTNDFKVLHFPTPYEIHAQTVMVKRSLYEKFGLYDERLRSRSDREMWWRFFGQSEKDEDKVKRAYVDYPVAYYRYHDKSMTMMRQRNRKYDKEVRKLAESIYKDKNKNGINKSNTIFLND